jgi:hypothetical protein
MGRKKLKGIGYWYSWGEPSFPFPQDLVGEYELALKEKLLAYLNYDRHSDDAYRGSSYCCFDGCDGLYGDGDLGNLDLSDGTWIWPEGLRHYVEVHDVLLPPAFLKDAQEPPRPSGVYFGRDHALGSWMEWANSQSTGELRERAEEAVAKLAEWTAQREGPPGPNNLAGYSADPMRGINRSIAESALADWVWKGGALPPLP